MYVQRQLPMGTFFVDVAYAGSHGVHLAQYQPTDINQIPDSFVALKRMPSVQARNPVGCVPTIATKIPNPLSGSPNANLNPVHSNSKYSSPGSLDWLSYPQYNDLKLAGSRMLR